MKKVNLIYEQNEAIYIAHFVKGTVLFEIIGYNFEDACISITIIDASRSTKEKKNESKIIWKKVSMQIVHEKLFDVIRIEYRFPTKLSLINYCGPSIYFSYDEEWIIKTCYTVKSRNARTFHSRKSALLTVGQIWSYDAHFLFKA